MCPPYIFSLLVILAFLPLPASAQTPNDVLSKIRTLMEYKHFDDALAFAQKAAVGDKGDPALAFLVAEIYYNKGTYGIAIENYINLMNGLTATNADPLMLRQVHRHLADAYHELGRKHRYTPEMCLRIMYEIERLIELAPELGQDERYIEFLRRSIGQYELTRSHPNNMSVTEDGDGQNVALPADYTDDDVKKQYQAKAARRVKDFDAALARAQAAGRTKSDKTIDELKKVIAARQGAVHSIHAVATGENNAHLEDLYFLAPDKFKSITPGAVTVVNNGKVTFIDARENKITEQSDFKSWSVSPLKSIGFYDLKEVEPFYTLTVQKVITCPEHLAEICKEYNPQLYLVTGRLITEGKGFYPPVPKIEYYIDLLTGLCLSERQYWYGVVGSGKDIELARETNIQHVQKTPEGITLPTDGQTIGHVQELQDITASWTLKIMALNAGVTEKDFNTAVPVPNTKQAGVRQPDKP